MISYLLFRVARNPSSLSAFCVILPNINFSIIQTIVFYSFPFSPCPPFRMFCELLATSTSRNMRKKDTIFLMRLATAALSFIFNYFEISVNAFAACWESGVYSCKKILKTVDASYPKHPALKRSQFLPGRTLMLHMYRTEQNSALFRAFQSVYAYSIMSSQTRDAF